MIFGLVGHADEEFDPVNHFDFSHCTIIIDSQATNMAMRNFKTVSWDGIRAVISSTSTNALEFCISTRLASTHY